MNNLAFDFNNLTGRKQKYYYLLSFFSLVIYSFITSYYVCVYKDVKVYMPLVCMVSFFIVPLGSLSEAAILSLVFKLTNKKSKFIKLLVGLCVIEMLCGTVIGSVFELIAISGVELNIVYSRIMIFIARGYLYHSSLSLTYKEYSLKTKIIGLIILSFDLIFIK